MRTNLDVQLSEALVREARAQWGMDAGGLWPGVDASASASYGHLYPGRGNNSQKSYAAGVNGVWNLDIFGGTRRLLESDSAAVVASRENLHDAQVTLASEVALDYLLLRGAQEQIAIARNNLKSEEHTADLTRQKLLRRIRQRPRRGQRRRPGGNDRSRDSRLRDHCAAGHFCFERAAQPPSRQFVG